ncbi:tRNA lysidine(34) synthetase TilS [Glutamicibacter sp. AOP12-B1-11]|uniref:tRNA lysidine(34) synthetase TilS n=1 Tax=Glutamicibacter sp. AOP12-B1-11 TaxID=3457725 RepID=UPI0040331C05
MSRPIDLARNAVAAQAGEFALLGVSGGADSLALAVAASQLRERIRFAVVIVDHGLQAGSAAVAARAAAQCQALGLEEVLLKTVHTAGDEASARAARYAAFEQAMEQTGAQRLLLAHTKDDQAEQVLLGILRGSGTRSLAGIPVSRGPYARPLLELTRQDTEHICARAGVEYWEDPSNADTAYRRNHIRHEVLPFLRAQLGGHLTEALARTAALAAADADALDSWAGRAWAQARSAAGVDLRILATFPEAIASRVLRLAAADAGALNLGSERTAALCALAGVGASKSRSDGPVQLEGKISALRRSSVIVFTTTSSTTLN